MITDHNTISHLAEIAQYQGEGPLLIPGQEITTYYGHANAWGIPYAAVAMSTDYDCWKEDEAPVSWEDILEVFKANVGNVTELLINTIPNLGTGE